MYNNLILSDEADKIAWNILISKLASCHNLMPNLNKNNIVIKLNREVKLTQRNAIFMIKDLINSDFDDTDINETTNWNKSTLMLYYFNYLQSL